jgi:hypothetical protein
MANQKVTQLTAATTSNDADLLYVVQAGVSKKTTKQLLMASTLAVANSAASTAASADTNANNALATANNAASTANNALSQASTAVQKSGDTMTGDLDMGGNQIENLGTPVATDDAATKGYVDVGLAGKQNTVATTTGVAITLDTPKEYGTYASPETGNITVSLTNAIRGIDQIVYHDDTVAPVIVVTGGTAVKFGPIDYDLNKVNLIVFFWMGGTDVGYIITPAV